VGEPTKDGILGTAYAPIHKNDALEDGSFKEKIWHTILLLAVPFFLLICGVGALVVHKGISKGITL